MDKPRMIYGKELAELISQMSLYRKTKPVLAVRLTEDIRLGEGFGSDIKGELTVSSGSWIAHDPENNRTWPISDEIFNSVYEPCPDE